MRESGFWKLLGDRERESLRAIARPRVFADNAILCLEGEPTTHVFIVLSGWVKIITVTSEGRETLAALRGEGDVVGEIAQVTGYRTATVQAIGTVRALIAAAEQFEAFLDAHPAADRSYRRVMTEYQRDAHSSQRSKTLSSGPQRLAALLLHLAEQHGERTESGLRTALPLSQDDLASLIGASRSTVTRALSDWRSRHIITTHPRHITILNHPALRRLAGRLFAISRCPTPEYVPRTRTTELM